MEKNQIINCLDKLNDEFGLAIGNFDGVHLGHQALLNNFSKECKKKNLKSVVVTFTPHPNIFLKRVSADYLLSNQGERCEEILNNGIDYVVLMPFDEKIQTMSAEKFIDEIFLSNKYLKYIHLGHDFKLGKGKESAFDILKHKANSLSIEIFKENSFQIKKQIVSSSLIRKLLKKDFNSATEYLGRPYYLSGTVITGRGVGRKKLFPTANLKTDEMNCIPSLGVYITRTKIDNIWHESVTNIGINPTIAEGNNISIESFLIFHSDNFYEKDIKIEFLEKIRKEKKFQSIEELKIQIGLDVEKTKDYFRKRSDIKLALIGKNISHSKSQVVYEKLLQKAVSYKIIDCKTESEIPTVEELFLNNIGTSITAPYKTHFLNKTKLIDSSVESVNTLIHNDGEFFSANTDKDGIREILTSYKKAGVSKAYILGDGSMGKIVLRLAKDLDIKTKVFSRKQYNLNQVSSSIKSLEDRSGLLVINCCSRDYLFNGPVDLQYDFWDLNYDLSAHKEYFSDSKVLYQDGMKLLELQAKYALNYWNLI